MSSEHQGQPTVASLDQLARAQRYAWAAEVCAGMTVLALDGRVEDTAALGAGARGLPSDGARRELLEDAGAVVWLDGADRASDPARILALLVELAGEGRTVVVAVPNGRAFDQRGLGAGVVYGMEDARALMARLPDGRMLSQHVLAGSMIRPGDGDVVTAAVPATAAGPEGARAWLVSANVGEDRLDAVHNQLALGGRPLQADLVTALEHANAELRRANGRLARQHLGRHDSAAASMVDKLAQRATAAEGRLADVERRLAIEIEVAKNNDQMYQHAKAALDVPRYRAVDSVRDKVLAVPGLAALARWSWRRLRG